MGKWIGIIGIAVLAGCGRVETDRPVATFSIVARDSERKEWGVAVASRVVAVGAVVPWARAGDGAIATQSYANTSFGPAGLDLLKSGLSSQETLDRLLSEDPGKERRQVAIIDARGRTASFTGDKCHPWAGVRSGVDYSCQGNLLTGPDVLAAMADAFTSTEGPLAWRLAEALEAGDRAGGDKRGKQSAAILVVRDKAGYGGFNDRLVDLRVDDHEDPVRELVRILPKVVARPKPSP